MSRQVSEPSRFCPDTGRQRIIVFTQPDSLSCEAVKLFLDDRGVLYEEKDVVASPNLAHELVEKYRSRSTPTVVVGDEVVIGFNPERIDQLLAR